MANKNFKANSLPYVMILFIISGLSTCQNSNGFFHELDVEISPLNAVYDTAVWTPKQCIFGKTSANGREVFVSVYQKVDDDTIHIYVMHDRQDGTFMHVFNE